MFRLDGVEEFLQREQTLHSHRKYGEEGENTVMAETRSSSSSLTGTSAAQYHVSISTGNKSDGLELKCYRSIVCSYGTVNCICTDDRFLLVGTSNGHVVVMLWSGETVQVISPDALSAALVHGRRDAMASPSRMAAEAVQVLRLEFHKGYGNHSMFAVVLSNGSFAFLKNAQQHQQNDTYNSSFVGFNVIHVQSVKACTIAMNHKRQLAAVGTTEGEVHLYRISIHDRKFELLRTLSLAERGCASEDIGQVSCLEFTKDGNAIAVGFSKRGMAVFDSTGVCIMSTIPRFAHSVKPNNQEHELLSSGTSSLVCSPVFLYFFSIDFQSISDTYLQTWHPDGYYLVSSAPDQKNFFTYTFFKTILTSNPSHSKHPYIALQGSNAVLLFHMLSDSDFLNAEWEQLQVPRNYLEANFPIKHTAISPDGQQIVAAGHKGCVLYNRQLRRWRLFGNQTQEREIKCVALTWVDNVVLALANKDHKNNAYELLLFPRYHLDLGSLVGRATIGKHRILYLSSTNGNALYCFDAAHVLHIFHIQMTFIGNDVSAHVQKIKSVSPLRRITRPLSMICIGRGIDRHSQHKNVEIYDRCIFHHLDATLTSVDLSRQNAQEEIIDTDIEQFWVETESKNRVIYFTHNRTNGLKLFIEQRRSLTKGPSTMSIPHFHRFDSSEYPLGPSKETGNFVCASVHITQTSISKFPFFEIKPRLHPYLHGIILSHLVEGEMGQSEIIRELDHLVNKDTFTVILEWLLFAALDETSTMQIVKETAIASSAGTEKDILANDNFSRNVNDRALFSAVVDFLRTFPQYHEVLVNCLRKTDISQWAPLLEYGCNPGEMFKDCLRNGMINEAANMLRILQQLYGLQNSKDCAYTLISPALEDHDFELAHELIRFINIIKQEENISDGGSSSTEQDDQLQHTPINYKEWLDGNIRLHTLVLRQARALLLESDLQALFIMKSTLSIPLTDWLSTEKHKAANLEIDADWEEAFDGLHRSFELPRASFLTSQQVDGLMHFSHKTMDQDNSAYFTFTQHHLYSINTTLEQMRSLLDCFSQAQCHAWSLLLATLLCDINHIHEVLFEKVPQLRQPYFELLQHEDNIAYEKLREIIQQKE